MPSGQGERTTLRRALGPLDAILICTGAIFGADIYVVTSFAMGELGPASIMAWILAGAAAIMLALCMAECSSMFPKAGGPYVYESAAFGMLASCIMGWATWVAEWAALATFPSTLVLYLMYFLPNLSSISQAIVRVLFILAVMTLLHRGIRETGYVDDALAIFEKTSLISFVLLGMRFFTWSGFAPFAPYGYEALGLTTVRVFWAYMGFELITMPAEEFRKPERDIPIGITASILIITLIYVLTNIALIGSWGHAAIAGSRTPIADVAALALGPIAGAIMGLAALDSMLASETGTYIGVSRLAYAMARDGFLPHEFADVHPRHRTPHFSIIIQGLAAALASNMFTINQLVIFSSFAILLSYTATAVAVIFLRIQTPNARRAFWIRGNLSIRGRKIPLIAVLAALTGLWIMVQTPTEHVLAGASACLVGFAVFLIVHLREGLRPSLMGLELPALKTLRELGGWRATREVVREVFGVPEPERRYMLLIEKALENLRTRYRRVLSKTTNGETAWTIAPKLRVDERRVLELIKLGDWKPVREEDLTDAALKESASRLLKSGILAQAEDGGIAVSDEAYKGLLT